MVDENPTTAALVENLYALVATLSAAHPTLPADLLRRFQQGNSGYATSGSRAEIIRLLNHPVITRPEKTKMLLGINRLDEERAQQAISKLRDTIEERTTESSNDEPSACPTLPAAPAPLPPATPIPAAPAAVDENGEVMAKAQVIDLLTGAESHAQLETLWIEEVKGVWGLDVDVLAAAKDARARLNTELQATA